MKPKLKRLINILVILLMVVGIIMLLWVNHKISNYVIPNTGYMIKEVMREARQTVKVQMWIGLIALISGYVLSFNFKWGK